MSRIQFVDSIIVIGRGVKDKDDLLMWHKPKKYFMSLGKRNFRVGQGKGSWTAEN